MYRRCRILYRQQQQKSLENHFCRLPAHTVRALLKDAASATGGARSSDLLDTCEGWVNEYGDNTTISNPSEFIEFLPLEIVTNGGENVYASFNGGFSTLPNRNIDKAIDYDWIEVPRSLVPASLERSNYSEEAEVLLRILPSIWDAKEVTLHPLMEIDYEMLLRFSDWLEGGGLLHQVSVVYHGQILDIQLPDNCDARAQVAAFDGEQQTDSPDHMLELDWPDEDKELPHSNLHDISSLEKACTSPRCRRLLENVRIVVLEPKIAENVDDESRAVVLLPCPCWQDYGPSMHLLSDYFHLSSLPLVPFGKVLVNPKGPAQCFLMDLNNSGSLGTTDYLVRVQVRSQCHAFQLPPTEDSSSAGVQSLILRMETSLLVRPGFVAFHPLQCQTLRLDPTSCESAVTIVPLAPWEMEGSYRTLELLEGKHAYLQLAPISVAGGHSHFFAQIQSSVDQDGDLAKLSASDQEAPISVGSLFVWNKKIFRLGVSYNDDREDSRHGKDAFIFGKDLVRLLSRKEINTPSSELLSTLLEPSTPMPRMLSLLPEPFVFPSQILANPPKFWHEYNMLLHGPSGCGKTLSALGFAALARLTHNAGTVYFDCKEHKNVSFTQLEDLLRALTNLIDCANRNDDNCRPCMVILDDLDEIYPNVVGQGAGANNFSSAQSIEQTSPALVQQAKVVGDHIRNLLQDVESPGKLSVIATCRDINAVSWAFSRHHYLSQTIRLPLLTAPEKVILLNKLVSDQENSGSQVVTSIATAGSSTSLPLEFRLRDVLPRDIEMLASRIRKRCGVPGLDADVYRVFSDVLDNYVSLSRRAAAEEARDSFMDWNDEVGGLFCAKRTLFDLVVRPTKFRRIYSTLRVRLPRGILLFGPPGCGKSIVPASLAKEVGLPLILCRGPEILDRYIGASEAKVRELFERATLSAPSILFFDEIDSLAPHRGSDLTGVTDRVVNQFLTFLDGVEDVLSGKTVYVMASTSRPDKIDSALLRPGRLEKHIYIGHPECREEVLDVFAKVSRNYPMESEAKEELVSGRLLDDHLSELTRMSPSDVKAVFDTAQIRAVRSYLDSDDSKNHAESTCNIQKSHLINALESSQLSISEAESLRLDEVYERFRFKGTVRKDVDKVIQRVALK